MNIRSDYSHTVRACYAGYITQAIVNNFAPLLFLTFRSSFGIPLSSVTLLVTINFAVQLLVDLLAAKYVDRFGYRISIVAAHVFAAAGLAGLAFFPSLGGNPFAGLVASVVLYAIGGGILEVLVSPIVEACPSDDKASAMSLLHSFYCWGHVFVVIVSTAFFALAGISNWRVLAIIWAVLPLANAVYFCLVPIGRLTAAGDELKIRDLLSLKGFWILVGLMVCAGASEQGMSQWASAFAESALRVPKAVGDLAGPCLFAGMMGLSRVVYSRMSERIDLPRFMAGSGVLCVVSYLLASLSLWPVLSLAGCALCGLSVGILWPGTFSLAARSCPRGGTALFAFLALAGDLGCGGGPTTVGFASSALGGNLKLGLLAALVFPIAMIALLRGMGRNNANR
jgi:MFS family permease